MVLSLPLVRQDQYEQLVLTETFGLTLELDCVSVSSHIIRRFVQVDEMIRMFVECL